MSNVIDINEDCWKFKVKGKIIEIAQATVEQEINHQNKLHELEKDGAPAERLYEQNLNYLESLGGDRESLRGISRHGFMQILRTITSLESKKK